MIRVFKNEYDAFLKEIDKVEKELVDVQLYKGRIAIFQGDGWHDNPIFRETEVKEKHLIAKLRLMKNRLSELKIEERDDSMISYEKLLYPDLVSFENGFVENKEEINEKQGNIIESPIKGKYIVSGIPGSGLNRVLLYRIAYLIYKHKMENDSILLIDQNDFFKAYNSYYLSKLITDEINHSSLIEFTNDFINEKLLLRENDYNNNNPESKIKKSIEFKEMIDRFLVDFFDKYYVTEDFMIDGIRIFEKEDIKNNLFESKNNEPNIEWAKMRYLTIFQDKKDEIFNRVLDYYKQILSNFSSDDIRRKEILEKRSQTIKSIKNNGVKLLKKYFANLDYKISYVYKLFIENIESYISDYSEIDIDDFKAKTIQFLDKKVVLNEDIPPLLYIGSILKHPKVQYESVLINNTHNFGDFHFYIFNKLFANSSVSFFEDEIIASFVNDCDDRITKINSNIHSDEYLIYKLDDNYIINKTIMGFANQVAKKIGIRQIDSKLYKENTESLKILEKNGEKSKIKDVLSTIDDDFERIAIVYNNDKEGKEIYKELSQNGIDSELISKKNASFNQKVLIVPIDYLYNLEFDGVIINDASSTNFSDSKENCFKVYNCANCCKKGFIIIYKKELSNIFNYSVHVNSKKMVLSKNVIGESSEKE